MKSAGEIIMPKSEIVPMGVPKCVEPSTHADERHGE
jgi:hypothetical protein